MRFALREEAKTRLFALAILEKMVKMIRKPLREEARMPRSEERAHP
jgi:hypothetical protein